ncbi:MAG TPA: DMT family transporter [Flavobacteriales bacterium]
MKNNRTANLLLLHFIVFIWGFTGILGKEISIAALPLVWWRTFIAAAAILLFALIAKRSLRVHFNELLKFAGVGLLTAAHWICFFTSIKVSNVSVALAVISTTAFFSAIVSPIINKLKFRWYELALGVIVIFGLSLIFKFESQYTLGILFALAASLLAAIFSSFNANLVKKHRATLIGFWEMAFACVGVSLYLLFNEQLDAEHLHISLTDFSLLLILGVVCTGFAFIAGIEVMKVLSPFTCALSINMEPVYTIAFALLIYGESEYMSPQFYLGALVIIFTLFLNLWLKKRFVSPT